MGPRAVFIIIIRVLAGALVVAVLLLDANSTVARLE